MNIQHRYFSLNYELRLRLYDFRYWLQFLRQRNLAIAHKSFEFNGKTYRYFIHYHNRTWYNERAVEIPLALAFMKRNSGKRVLEVGCVLPHYRCKGHHVLDKYERFVRNTIRQDVVDYQSAQPYDAIVSISTLEHVGWDESKRESDKIWRAVHNLRSMLAESGQSLITAPIGHNSYLDSALSQGIFSEAYYLKRISPENYWEQVDAAEALQCKYGHPYPNGNAIVVGVL